jgi:hypothetical protein
MTELLPCNIDERVAVLLRDKYDARLLDPEQVKRVIGPLSAGWYARRRAADLSRQKLVAMRADPMFRYLRTVLNGARKNGIRAGKGCELTEMDLHAIYVASGNRCAVTGVPFSLDRYGTTRAPFAPSIDRIDSALGYTRKNVRLTCQIANLAMNVWSADVLRDFIERAAKRSAPSP